MKNPAVKGFLIAVIAVLFSFGIYFLFLEKKDYFLVDNPTENSFYFTVNKGTENIITSGQSVKVSLNKGKNSIAVFDQNKKLLYDSTFTVTQKRGLLNIAHQDYFINRQYYGHLQNKDSLLLLNKLIIDDKEYLGDVKRINRLYSEDFYFNIDEEYDPIVKANQKAESRTKIFRKQDFINYYKEYYKF